MIGPLAPPLTAQQPAASPASATPSDRDALVEAANAFEAIFLRQMLSAMQQAKLGDDLTGSSATEQFQTMQHDQIADTMATSGDFGIAEMLLRQFRPGSAPP